jgi:GLPGLI family protein
MKHAATTALLSFALFLPSVCWAQQGAVTYDETVKFDIELPPEMADMKDQIPNSQTSKKVLLFNQVSSLMKPAQADAKPTNVVHQGEGMVFKMGRAGEENETYVNFDDETVVEKRDFMGRIFLITGSPAPLEWKITGERSEFIGYMCMKATAVRDSTTLEAWFTPEVPVPAGPETYGGLPGLILVLNIDDGQRTFVATDLTLEELAEGSIEAPKKGKKVSREEYDEIVEEKMKEMGAESAGKGGNKFMITIRN